MKVLAQAPNFSPAVIGAVLTTVSDRCGAGGTGKGSADVSFADPAWLDAVRGRVATRAGSGVLKIPAYATNEMPSVAVTAPFGSGCAAAAVAGARPSLPAFFSESGESCAATIIGVVSNTRNANRIAAAFDRMTS